MAPDRAAARGLGHGRRRDRQPTRHVLLRRRRRRRMEDHRRRPHLVAALRAGPRLHRRHRDRHVGSADPLCRHGADLDSLRHRGRRGDVSLGRRRGVVACGRARADAPHRRDLDRSARRADRAGRSARSRLRTARAARRVSYRERRQELGAHPVRERTHGRRRPGCRSAGSRPGVRRGLAGALLAVAQLFHADCRDRERSLQVHGRRAPLGAPRRSRLAGGRARPHRACSHPHGEGNTRVRRHRCGEKRRPVPLRRRRGELEARQRR